MNLHEIAAAQPPDSAKDTGRPAGHPEHLPYICRFSGRVCIDRVPNTEEEVRACGDALRAIYTTLSGAT
jgi:hypothetical protein